MGDTRNRQPPLVDRGVISVSTVEANVDADIKDWSATSSANEAPPSPAQGSTARSIDARWLDWGERISVLLLYGWLVSKLVHDYSSQGGFANLLLLPSEGLVVVFVLLRRQTTEITRSF